MPHVFVITCHDLGQHLGGIPCPASRAAGPVSPSCRAMRTSSGRGHGPHRPHQGHGGLRRQSRDVDHHCVAVGTADQCEGVGAVGHRDSIAGSGHGRRQAGLPVRVSTRDQNGPFVHRHPPRPCHPARRGEDGRASRALVAVLPVWEPPTVSVAPRAGTTMRGR